MLLRIARKEIVDIWRDGRLRATAAVVLVLMAASLATGWSDAVRARRERASAQVAMRQQWETQGDKNPHSAAHYSIFAFRPRPPLSFVDAGIDPYVGIAVWLEAHKQNDFRYRPARDSTAASRFGEATAVFVLQILLPLVLIAFVAPVVTGEREAGTYLLLLATGIGPRQMMTGKMLGVSLALALLVAPAAVAGGLVLVSAFGINADLLERAALMALGYTAYLAIFVGLGLIVSSLSRSSRIALATLLVFWVANSVVPRIMSDLASRRYPLPSSAEMVNAMNAQMREGVDGHDPENARTDELRASLLAQYGVTDERQLPVNFDGISLQAGEEYGSAIFDRFYGELWTQIRRQNRLRLTGAVVSPLAAIQPWSLALAGMDWMHQERFAAAAETYRRRLVKTMNDELSYRSQAAPYEAVQRGREFWLAMPDFTYTPPPLSDVLHEVRGAALMLAGWLAAIAIGCVLAAGQIGRVFKW